MRLARTLRRAVPLAVSACVGAPAWVHAQTFVLRERFEAVGAHVRLGDVAELEGLSAAERTRTAGIVVAEAPRPGQVVLVDRARVLARLPAGWRARGAAAAHVARAVRPIDPQALCEAELVALEPRLAALPRAVARSAQCAVDAPGTVLVPAGSGQPRADVSGVQLVDGPQRASIALPGLDGDVQAVALTLRLTLTAVQWCARAPMAPSDAVRPERFVACSMPVRHERDIAAAGAPLPAGRLRRALHAQEMLRPGDVAGPDDALAGDAVTVRAHQGGFAIEAGGHLLQDARVGDAVRVQIGSAGAPALGHLTGDRLVELENRP